MPATYLSTTPGTAVCWEPWTSTSFGTTHDNDSDDDVDNDGDGNGDDEDRNDHDGDDNDDDYDDDAGDVAAADDNDEDDFYKLFSVLDFCKFIVYLFKCLFIYLLFIYFIYFKPEYTQCQSLLGVTYPPSHCGVLLWLKNVNIYFPK